MKPLWEWGTWASCSPDQRQYGYHTPSPPHQWTHHIAEERLHQSNTMPQGNPASSPLGKTLETVFKSDIISTNKPQVKVKNKTSRFPSETKGCTSPSAYSTFKKQSKIGSRKTKYPVRAGAKKRKGERKEPRKTNKSWFIAERLQCWNKSIYGSEIEEMVEEEKVGLFIWQL